MPRRCHCRRAGWGRALCGQFLSGEGQQLVVWLRGLLGALREPREGVWCRGQGSEPTTARPAHAVPSSLPGHRWPLPLHPGVWGPSLPAGHLLPTLTGCLERSPLGQSSALLSLRFCPSTSAPRTSPLPWAYVGVAPRGAPRACFTGVFSQAESRPGLVFPTPDGTLGHKGVWRWSLRLRGVPRPTQQGSPGSARVS